jgi:hypothetical protein
MQGVFPRFKSKKAFREEADQASFEATSMFGNEYDGPIIEAPNGTYYVVGPCPHMNRKWYASVTVRDGKVTVK